MNDWIKAAENYKVATLKDERKKAVADLMGSDKDPEKDEEFIDAANELLDFVYSPTGVSAMDLLRCSRQRILFAESVEEGTTTKTVWYFDETGLHLTIDTIAGDFGFMADKSHHGSVHDIYPRTAVEAAITYGNKNPNEVLRWLCEELDKIAASAPQPEE